MNSKLQRIMWALLLGLGMASASAAFAKDEILVQTAQPGEAPQGTVNLDVEIGGVGFDNSASVRFLVSGSKSDNGGIRVNHVSFQNPNKIIANIDVTDTATASAFDIEVKMSRGRGGKGTGLFVVKVSDDIGNKDGDGISMICAINENDDVMSTLGNDKWVNPDTSIGSAFYVSGLENVLCHSGGVIQGRLAGLRMRTESGGNYRTVLRFLDLTLDHPACESEDPPVAGCWSLEDPLLTRLPTELKVASPDLVKLDVAPYEDVLGHDHIQLMAPGLYQMRMHLEPLNLPERYMIRMMDRTELPPGQLPGFTCPFDVGSASDDVNVYIWRDGVFSGTEPDGLPDGYTVSTGVITPWSESFEAPPTVSPGWAEGLICSNISLTGEPCASKREKNSLCHNLGKVPLRFTLHMQYQ